MKKTTLWALAILASIWGIAADFPSYLEGDWGVTASVIVGPAFALAGALAGARRPGNPIGGILLLIAFVWPIGSLYKYPGMVVTGQIALGGFWLWVIPLTYLVLAFPSGRLERRKDALVCWLISLPAFWLVIAPFPFYRFRDPFTHKGLVRPEAKPIVEALDLISMTLAVVCVGMVVARVRDKWRRATPAGRRVLAPVVITGSIALAATVLIVLGQIYIPAMKEVGSTLNRVLWLFVATVPFGFMLGLSRARARRARVGELVVELGELPSPERLQDALRKALGDETLIAALWVPDAQRYLTTEGRTLTLPDEASSSVPTFIERDGEPLAVIVHDRYLMEDPALVASATAAARLAVENERLQQEVVEQLIEVRASRSRIVQAGDEARKRLERNLHDGAQQRLVTLGLKLQRLTAKLGPLDEESLAVMEDAKGDLKAALTELRDLARGLHPLVLTEEGLVAAVETLCAKAPLPVTIDTATIGRLPEPLETAAYFMVSEALANVAKHSHATKVAIRLAVVGDRLEVTVSDDGVGGASIAAGSGLRGLVDRIQALDGSISILSPLGGGTAITAELPTTLAEFETEMPEPAESHPVIANRIAHQTSVIPLLRVRDLDVFYGDQQVLFDIKLDVGAGEIVALLGTNGAGKSTLTRTLAGLHEHVRGSINLQGKELTDVGPEHRTRGGLVFIEGGAGVFEPLTVNENLKLFSRHAGVSQEEGIERAFDAFPLLADRTTQRAGSMSRGEQHMLALTRAVICDASIVVVDELSLGLAPEATDDAYSHLQAVNARGTSVLFVEQAATTAARIATRAYFLDAGRVVFEGPIGDLEASGLLVPVWMESERLVRA